MTSSAETIARFVRQIGLRHRLWALGLALMSHALVLGVALCIVDLVAGAWLGIAAVASGCWLVLVGVRAWARERMPVEEADRELGLQDRLLTWIGVRADARAGAMVEWLEDDLGSRLASVPGERRRRLWRRPLGRLRYLLPILVVLLALRSFAPLLPPTGAGGSASRPGEGGGGARSASAAGGQERRAESARPRSGGAARAPGERREREREQERGSPDSIRAAPRPPLLHLPPRDEFVIPAFFGDGPSREALVRKAVLEEEIGRPGGGAGAGARGAARRGRSPERPIARAQSFRKAFEEAIRARHVPPEERAFVKAYFDALAETGR